MPIDQIPHTEPGYDHDQTSAHEYEYDSPLAEYFINNQHLVAAAEQAWHMLDDLVKEFSSDEFCNSILDPALKYTDPTASVDSLNAKSLRTLKSQISETMSNCVNQAQAMAAFIMWNHPQDVSSQEKSTRRKQLRFEAHQHGASRIPDGADERDLNYIIASLTLDVADAFCAAYQAEEDLTDPMCEIMSQDAMQVEDLVGFLEDQCGTGTFDGLIAALARLHYDPKSVSPFSASLDAIGEVPESYTDIYVNNLKTRLEDPEVEITDGLEVVSLLAKLAVRGEVPDKILLELFTTETSLTEYPKVLQEDFKEQLEAFKRDIMCRAELILAPFNFPKRFAPDMHMEPTKRSTPSRKRKRPVVSGRAQPKQFHNQPTYSPEGDPRRPTSAVYIGKRTNGTYTKQLVAKVELTDASSAEGDAPLDILIDEIIKTREVQGYLKKYSCTEDMRNIFDEIMKNPRSNSGSAVMQSQQARTAFVELNGKKVFKTLPVLRYSPQQATNGRGLKGQQTNRTRIFYTHFKDEDGNESIMLLGVEHKSKSEKSHGPGGAA